MGKHRYRIGKSGWSASVDPEWRFRKLLDKYERDAFDAMDDDERRLLVERWELEQVGFTFK